MALSLAEVNKMGPENKPRRKEASFGLHSALDDAHCDRRAEPMCGKRGRATERARIKHDHQR